MDISQHKGACLKIVWRSQTSVSTKVHRMFYERGLVCEEGTAWGDVKQVLFPSMVQYDDQGHGMTGESCGARAMCQVPEADLCEIGTREIWLAYPDLRSDSLCVTGFQCRNTCSALSTSTLMFYYLREITIVFIYTYSCCHEVKKPQFRGRGSPHGACMHIIRKFPINIFIIYMQWWPSEKNIFTLFLYLVSGVRVHLGEQRLMVEVKSQTSSLCFKKDVREFNI